ncbi:MAG: hypothetical protein ACYTG0_09805 [Planctomycetota bacterium]|jgi:hypothetical protein
MHPFIEAISVVGAACIGIIALVTFFVCFSWLSGKARRQAPVKLQGLLNESDRVTMHLAGGKKLENVRFVGLTDPASLKGLPFDLANMVIVEDESGLRTLIRANLVRMIEECREDVD